MNEQVITDFFDFSKPCPQEIPFCNQIRLKYQSELNGLNTTGCTSCQRNSLKAKYMKEVWEGYLREFVRKESAK